MISKLALLVLALAALPVSAQEQPTEQELAERAVWIVGRVVFPEEHDADEEVRITAKGRPFRSASYHTATVGRDGVFRVAVREDSKLVGLYLEARYLFLEEPLKLPGSLLEQPLELRPRIGGALRGRLVGGGGGVARAYASSEFGGFFFPPDEVELRADGSFSVALPAEPSYEVLVRANGKAYRFDGLPVRLGRTTSFALDPNAPPRLHLLATGADGLGLPDVQLVFNGNVQGRTSGSGELDVDLGPWVDVPVDHWFVEEGEVGRWRQVEGELQGDGYRPLRWSLRIENAAQGEMAGLDLELPLEEGAGLTGVVLLPDGDPAVGAYVELRRPKAPQRTVWFGNAEPDAFTEDDRVLTTSTDTSGAFSFVGLDPETEYQLVALQPSAADPASRYVAEVPVRAGRRPGRLVLSEGASLSGRMVDETGRVLPPAERIVRAVRQPERSAADRVEVLARTEGDSWRLSGLLPGSWSIEPVGQQLSVGPTVVEVATIGQLVDAGDLQVVRSATVSGRILGPDGAPVPDAFVSASLLQGFVIYREYPKPVTYTDVDGRFTLRGVTPGGVVLHGAGMEHTDWQDHVQLAPGEVRALEDRRLDPAGAVEGRALAADGSPLAGEEVFLYGPWDVESPTFESVTDDGGSFRFEGIAPARYELNFGGDRVRARCGPVFDLSAGETVAADLRLPSRGRGRRVFVRATAGARVPSGLSPFLGPEGAYAADSTSVLAFNGEAYEGRGFEDEQTLTMMQGEVFLSRRSLSLAERGATRLDLALPTGKVRVELAGGRGIDTDFVPVWIEPERWLDPLPFGARYTEDGLAVFRFLPDGRYRILAGSSEDSWSERDPMFLATRTALVEVANGKRSIVRMPMARSAGLSGIVRLSDGTPVPFARVRVWSSDRQSLDLQDLRADALGRFTTWNLPEGGGWVAGASAGAASPRPLELRYLEAGKSQTVELTLEPAPSFAVRFEDAAGNPLRARFRAVDADGFAYRGLDARRALQRDENSGFGLGLDLLPPERAVFLDFFEWELGALPPGTYRLQAKTLDGRSVEEVLELEGLGLQMHTVRFP